MQSFKAQEAQDAIEIDRSIDGAPYRQYVVVLGRTEPIRRYRAERLMALLEATAELSLEDLRALKRLKDVNNAYWKCILAFIEDARFTPFAPLAEIEQQNRSE